MSVTANSPNVTMNVNEASVRATLLSGALLPTADAISANVKEPTLQRNISSSSCAEILSLAMAQRPGSILVPGSNPAARYSTSARVVFSDRMKKGRTASRKLRGAPAEVSEG
jgi:hypothetical protein